MINCYRARLRLFSEANLYLNLCCKHEKGKSLRDAGMMASAAGALGAMKQGPMEGDINPETAVAMMHNNNGRNLL